MASGVPVVAYSVGGLPEVIENGRSGILIDGRDYKMMAEKLSVLLDDVPMRMKIIKNARLRVEQLFDIEMVIQQYSKCYREI